MDRGPRETENEIKIFAEVIKGDEDHKRPLGGKGD